jgi:hypothetical protein
LRGTIKKIADGLTYTTPATIDDAASLTELTRVLCASTGAS